MQVWLERAVVCLNLARVWPSLLALIFSAKDAPIRGDIRRWCEILFQEQDVGGLRLLYRHAHLMALHREYRNLAYIRLPGALAYRWLMPRLPGLHLNIRNVGPGFYIQHGFSSIVAAESIGKNFWLNQQVTIGYANDFDKPTIGDDVTVRPGAKIVGKLRIGDGATVGMNTVVTRNVPAGATVFGVPGQIIWRKPVQS